MLAKTEAERPTAAEVEARAAGHRGERRRRRSTAPFAGSGQEGATAHAAAAAHAAAGARRGDGSRHRHAAATRRPPDDADRAGRHRQDTAGHPGRGGPGLGVRGRRRLRQSRADRRSETGALGHRVGARPARDRRAPAADVDRRPPVQHGAHAAADRQLRAGGRGRRTRARSARRVSGADGAGHQPRRAAHLRRARVPRPAAAAASARSARVAVGRCCSRRRSRCSSSARPQGARISR